MTRAAFLAPLLLLIVGGGFGGMLGLARYATAHGISPLAFSCGQAIGAAAVLLPLCLIARRAPPLDARHLRYYAISALAGSVFPVSLTFFLVRRLGTGVTGLMFALSPIFTYAIAMIGRIEPFDRLRASGIGLGLIGAAMIVLPRAALPAGIEPIWLVLLLLVPLSLAIGNIYRSWAWPAGTAGPSLAAGTMTASMVMLLPVTLASGAFYWPIPPASGPDWALAIVIGLAGLYFVLFFELQRIGGGVYISLISYVITVSSLAIGLVIFEERLSAWLWGAAAVIFVGIVLVNLRRGIGSPPPAQNQDSSHAQHRP